jgi:hypothetical protein
MLGLYKKLSPHRLLAIIESVSLSRRHPWADHTLPRFSRSLSKGVSRCLTTPDSGAVTMQGNSFLALLKSALLLSLPLLLLQCQ